MRGQKGLTGPHTNLGPRALTLASPTYSRLGSRGPKRADLLISVRSVVQLHSGPLLVSCRPIAGSPRWGGGCASHARGPRSVRQNRRFLLPLPSASQGPSFSGTALPPGVGGARVEHPMRLRTCPVTSWRDRSRSLRAVVAAAALATGVSQAAGAQDTLPPSQGGYVHSLGLPELYKPYT